jgi:hypothetical protein
MPLAAASRQGTDPIWWGREDEVMGFAWSGKRYCHPILQGTECLKMQMLLLQKVEAEQRRSW